ncbi:MAG: polysaccharide deacetylase family protein [Candidatus Omnitrophota bacterium]
MLKILMYHSVGSLNLSEVGTELYSVSEENFRQQMNFLRNAHDAIHNTLITFDDGLLDNYTTAFPILKEFDIKAYFFILTSKVREEGYMNWEQIKELHNAGMTIGSHGMTHRLLTELSENELYYELSQSKKILEDNLSQPVENFSIPRGFCNKRIEEAAKKIGYKAIFTSNIKDNNGFRIGRIPVKRDWDLNHFKSVLNNGLSPREKVEEFVKRISKEFLGARVYDKIRSRILSR